MTKEEKIEEAYDKIGLPFSENILFGNGWLKIRPTQYENLYDKVDVLKLTKHVHSIRPKSLQGIENNNGWIKIESEADLPKEECVIHVFPNYLENDIFFYHNDKISKKELMGNHTHYQLVEKPKPPIY